MAQLKGSDRVRYIQDMFARIAGRYDLMNRLMTAGQDRAWRRLVVELVALPSGGRLLDLGTGTGEIAFEALRRTPNATVVGADFTLEMMRLAQAKGLERQTSNVSVTASRRPVRDDVSRLTFDASRTAPLWVAADALRLPFPDDTFDAVTSGFLMRNLADVQAGFVEQRRIVRPGGRVVCLDTSPPPDGVLRPFIEFHMHRIIPWLGRMVTGQADAYAYLPASTAAFLTPEELGAIMEAAGLRQVHYRRRMFGTVAVHVGVKE